MKRLLEPSKLGHILTNNPALQNYQTAEGEFIKYKGRLYCWVNISENGIIRLNQQILGFLNLKIGIELLSIRSSDIAFTMGAAGPLLERADNYEGEIPLYQKSRHHDTHPKFSIPHTIESTLRILSIVVNN